MPSAAHTQVIIYTNLSGPGWLAFKAWLEREGFVVRAGDISDRGIVAETKAHTGELMVPIALVSKGYTAPVSRRMYRDRLPHRVSAPPPASEPW